MNESRPRQRADDIAAAAVLGLIVLEAVMLLALLSRTQPHPPHEVGPFAMAPFIGASLAVGVMAARLLSGGCWTGHLAALAFAGTALVCYGPQKYVDPSFDRIWPAVLPAQAAIAVLVVASVLALRRRWREG